MGNTFVNIPVPTANGSGAAVDVSGMGASKTISLAGPFQAWVTIEVSNELVPTVWAPLITLGTPDGIVKDVAARWMRATVSDYKSGAPACDVGSDDSGASFATLVATAGNGEGAAVDVSDLPLFKSIIVGGTYRGNVQIEVSEDGVSNWSQIGFGFPNAGLQSQEITAHYMRVVRSGVPLISPGLPIIEIAACAGGGGGGGGGAQITQFTYRPGSGLAGPYVWDDFAALYVAFDAARTEQQVSGKFQIIFDDQDASPVVVSASGLGAVTYDFTDAELIGVHEDANVTLQFTDGGGEGDSLTVTHALWFEGLDVYSTGSRYVITPADGETITLTRASFNGGPAQVIGMFSVDCVINLENESRLHVPDGAAHEPIVLNNGTLTIHANGNTCLIDAAVISTGLGGAIIVIDVNSSSAIIDFNQIATLSANTNCAASFWYDSSPNTDPNGLIAGAISGGNLLVNPTTGVVWRCTGGTGWTLLNAVDTEQRFSYTVTGAEPDKANIVVALPAARANALYKVQCTQGTFAALLGQAVPVASRTNAQFVLSLSAMATAGDTFDFIVSDPT
jgi:hypothetical protein